MVIVHLSADQLRLDGVEGLKGLKGGAYCIVRSRAGCRDAKILYEYRARRSIGFRCSVHETFLFPTTSPTKYWLPLFRS